MNPVVCIAGPTASGKSAWAVSLAKKHDGEIINADALQVYQDLTILSARPMPEEMADVPHHLFGHVKGATRYSTGIWLREVVPLIMDILARDKLPILVGGTGLYFKALTEGLADIPSPDARAVNEANRILAEEGIMRLRAEAERLDAIATSRVLGDDPQRLLRIVTVALGTSAPLSVWQRNTRPAIPESSWIGAKLLPDRAMLYERINQRFDIMVREGGLEEVKGLLVQGLAADLPVMKAIGVPQLTQVMTGEVTLSAALEWAKRDTRRFAKRQFTWLRGNMQTWTAIKNVSDKLAFKNKISKINV